MTLRCHLPCVEPEYHLAPRPSASPSSKWLRAEAFPHCAEQSTSDLPLPEVFFSAGGMLMETDLC